MRRILLHGESLSHFPNDQESGYVKLVLNSGAADKPLLRSYTVRAFDGERRELTLDFVDHGDAGPASSWASSKLARTAKTPQSPVRCSTRARAYSAIARSRMRSSTRSTTAPSRWSRS